MSNKVPENRDLLKTHKLYLIWKDTVAKKILIDIFSNSQFRRCKYLKKQFLDKLEMLIRSRIPDEQIYKEMFKYIHITLSKNSKKLLNLNNHHFRSINRAEKIQFLIRKYLKTENQNFDTNKRKSISILDVGCADGHITIRVGDYLDLQPSQLHGVDVTNLAVDHPNNEKFNFKHLTQSCDTKLPYDDESQDVVLALMSLHHIHNIEMMISEIQRVMKKGGIFIIREHDSIGIKFPVILDVVHGFYGMVWSNPPEFDFLKDYYAKYFSKDDMKNLIEHHNFKEIYNDCRTEPYPQFHRNKVINPLKYYYGVFLKPFNY